MQQVQGNKTLFEVIVLAGGMRPGVGSKVNITRERFWGRRTPLSSARDDTAGKYSGY